MDRGGVGGTQKDARSAPALGRKLKAAHLDARERPGFGDGGGDAGAAQAFGQRPGLLRRRFGMQQEEAMQGEPHGGDGGGIEFFCRVAPDDHPVVCRRGFGDQQRGEQRGALTRIRKKLVDGAAGKDAAGEQVVECGQAGGKGFLRCRRRLTERGIVRLLERIKTTVVTRDELHGSFDGTIQFASR